MKGKRKITTKELLVRGGVCLLALLFAGFLYLFNSNIQIQPLVSTQGREFARATVVDITKDNLAEDGNRYGNQEVMLHIDDGQYAGETVAATSANGQLFGANCTVGMHVVAIVSGAGDTRAVSVYSANREWAVIGFIALFLLLICVIGGKNGCKSALGLVFTFICIFGLLLPMIYLGMSPFWSAVLICVVTTIVTMGLIGGFTVKTVCAIAGTVAGVVLAGVFAWLFGLVADIDGYNVSDIESLLFVSQSAPINIGELLFAGILISALGAVMDVAMSVSSATNEIYQNSPGMTATRLFRSGMAVGRDMMGTMSNTLVLAFAGGSLGMLLLNYAYNLPYLQLINSYNIGLEIMQGVSGSIGIILTVPIVSWLSAMLTPRFLRKSSGSSQAEPLS